MFRLVYRSSLCHGIVQRSATMHAHMVRHPPGVFLLQKGVEEEEVLVAQEQDAFTLSRAAQ